MPTARYRHGRLVWARLRSASGQKELHPAIIISDNVEITQPEAFDPRVDFNRVNAVAVVGVSTEYKRYPPFFSLPFLKKSGGHPQTKLTQECGACIGWYAWVVLEDDIDGRGGDVPSPEMKMIMEMIMQDLAGKLRRKAVDVQQEMITIVAALTTLIGPP